MDEWPKSVVKHDGTEFGDASYYLETDYENEEVNIDEYNSPGEYLSAREKHLQNEIQRVYKERITLGIAKEQARKDLPLSTYTEAYWKINLHNLLHFLSLRMDSHAQYEIRTYANAIYQLIKPIVPVACEAFEDYRLNACTFSAQEMELIRKLVSDHHSTYNGTKYDISFNKPSSLSEREWKELKEKLCI